MLDDFEDVNDKVAIIHKNSVDVHKVILNDGMTSTGDAEIDWFSFFLIRINQCPEAEVSLLFLDTKNLGILGKCYLHIILDGEDIFPDSLLVSL